MSMGAITIRKLDDDVIAGLKRRAKANGRSMEEEARRVLEGAAKTPPPPEQSVRSNAAELEALEVVAQALKGPDGRFRPGPELVDYMRRWQKATFGDRTFPSSVELFRELRDEDPTAWNGK
jgi:plasmid stability protein